jgi:hypothetical protein
MAADCWEVRLLDRIVADLQAIDATGSYHYDFRTTNGTPRVKIGQLPLVPDTLPMAAVAWAGESNEHGEPLGRYKRTPRFEIAVAVPWTDDDTGTRTKAVLNALFDVTSVLETDRTLNSNCSDLIIRNKAEIVVGDDDGDIPGVAIGSLVVEPWQSRAGGA